MKIRDKAAYYTTADFLRNDCDLKLDISNMLEVESGSFDIVIAFDVLEHVPSYQKALGEVQRILSSRGFGCRYFLSRVMRHVRVLGPGSQGSLYPRCRRGVSFPTSVFVSRRSPSPC